MAEELCSLDSRCIGITYVPWEKHNEQYTLRKEWNHSGVLVFTTDGQLSYLKSCRIESNLLKIPVFETSETTIKEILSKDIIDTNDRVETNIIKENLLKTTTEANERVETDVIIYKENLPNKTMETDERIEIDYGEPSVFVGIVAYGTCRTTLESLLVNATYSHRLRIGLVYTPVINETESCEVDEAFCLSNPKYPLCTFRSQIRVVRVPDGPAPRRFKMNQLYTHEYFALEVTAPFVFSSGWDELAISQFNKTRNGNAVLSSFILPHKPQAVTVTCDSKFVGNSKVLTHTHAQVFAHVDSPILQPWVSLGFLFSRGHRVQRVGHQCCLPVVHQDLDTLFTYRLWTHGYDVYSFNPSIGVRPVFNEYLSSGESIFAKQHGSLMARSEMALRNIIESQQISKEGLGTVRKLSVFLQLIGINYSKMKLRNLCGPVVSLDFHHALVPFLSIDGNGLDYSRIDAWLDFKKASKRAKRGLGEYASLPMIQN